MNKLIALAVSAILLAACAKRPDAIAPMSMPANAYAGLSCEQLAAEHRRSTASLSAVSKAQNDAATGDAFSVFLVGVPIASAAGGDKEGLVAQHKGELIAIGAAQRSKGC